MFIAVNTIKVEEPEQMAAMFNHSAPHLKAFDGFLGFELWKGEKQVKAVSKWKSKEAFEQYTNSDMFKEQHKGMDTSEANQRAQVAYFEGDTIV